MKGLRRGQLPLIILRLLQQGDMYGYGIRQAVEQLIGGEYQLKEGTLYPMLHAFEAKGIVESTWRVSDDGPPRKYYRLTEKGLRQLERETQSEREFNAFLQGTE